LELAVILAHLKLPGERDVAEEKKKIWTEDVLGLMGIYNQEERANETVLGMNPMSGSGY